MQALQLFLLVLTCGAIGYLVARRFDPDRRRAQALLKQVARDGGGAESRRREAEAQVTKLMQQLSTCRHERDQLEQDLQVLRKERLSRLDYFVFVDGDTAAGKTTFIRRVSEPWVNAKDLVNTTASGLYMESQPHPVCFSGDGSVVESLVFVDGVGEQSNAIAGAIQAFFLKAAQRATTATAAFLIWDLAKPWEKNHGYFNKPRMQAIYLSADGTPLFRNFVVLLNKVDEHPLTPEALKEMEDRIRREVFSFAPDIIVTVTAGSAVTGAGVHRALGLVLDAVGIPRGAGVPVPRPG